MKKSDAVLVSFVQGNEPLLIVGRKNIGETVQIINAFSGKEAEELYKKLVEKR